jgi:ribosomal protein L7/L12
MDTSEMSKKSAREVVENLRALSRVASSYEERMVFDHFAGQIHMGCRTKIAVEESFTRLLSAVAAAREVLATYDPDAVDVADDLKRYTLVLTGVHNNDRFPRVDIIRKVRDVTGLGLKESRELVDKAIETGGAIVLEKVSSALSAAATKMLRSVGAEVVVQPYHKVVGQD